MRTVIPTISSLVWLQGAPQSCTNGQNRALRAILSEHTAPLLPRRATQPHRMGSESHERCLIPNGDCAAYIDFAWEALAASAFLWPMFSPRHGCIPLRWRSQGNALAAQAR